MTDIKGKWDLLKQDRKQSLIKELITYFKTERDMEIGIVAAGEVLNFFLEAAGPDIYNKGIFDAKTIVRNSMENIEVDLDLLEK